MFKFFDAIAQFIGIIVDFIVTTITNLYNMVVMIAKGYGAVSLAMFHMPTFLQVFALAVISYCIIINLINKGG